MGDYAGWSIITGTSSKLLILNLNSHTLTCNGGGDITNSRIEITDGALKLTDSSQTGNGKIRVGDNQDVMYDIQISGADNGYFEMAGGTIEVFSNNAVYLNSKLGQYTGLAFKMIGGTIQGNGLDAVNNTSGTVTIITGGSIINNTGAGVCNGKVIMSGGTILGNRDGGLSATAISNVAAVKVNKADSTPATVAANNRTYDGTEKPLVTVDDSTLDGGTMWYALGENATTAPVFDGTSEAADKKWSTSIQTGSNAGTYYVWTMVKGGANYNDSAAQPVTVTVGPKSLTGAMVTLSATGLTYTGAQQGVTVTGVTIDNLTPTAEDYDVTGVTGTKAQEYTATMTGKGNYKDGATAKWTIGHKTMTVSAPDVSAVYDGHKHGIAVTVTDPASGATVKYGKAEGTYDLDAGPEIENVPDSPVTVYYRVTAANYSDYTGKATVTVTKAAAKAATAPGAKTLTFTGKDQELVTAGVPEGGKMAYSLDGQTYGEAVPKGNAAKEYTVYFKTAEDAEPQTLAVTIAKADVVFTPPEAATGEA